MIDDETYDTISDALDILFRFISENPTASPSEMDSVLAAYGLPSLEECVEAMGDDEPTPQELAANMVRFEEFLKRGGGGLEDFERMTN